MATEALDILIAARDNASKDLDRVRGAMRTLGSAADSTKRKLQAMRMPLLALTGALAGVGGASVKLASDAEESINAVNVVFGEASKAVLNFGKTASQTVGLSSTEFNQLAMQTGALLKATGMNMDQVAQQTTRLTQRAADMASVFNTSVADAMSAINQSLRGETEAIRRYSGDVTDATLQSFALAQGIDKAVTAMTQEEKRLLRVELIMQQTADTAGDFANTQDSLANQMRITESTIKDVAAELGKTLIPIAKTATSTMLALVRMFADLEPETKKTILVIGGVTAALGFLGLALPPIITSIQLMATATAILRGAVGGPAGAAIAIAGMGLAAAGAVAAFREINAQVKALKNNLDSLSESSLEDPNFQRDNLLRERARLEEERIRLEQEFLQLRRAGPKLSNELIAVEDRLNQTIQKQTEVEIALFKVNRTLHQSKTDLADAADTMGVSFSKLQDETADLSRTLEILAAARRRAFEQDADAIRTTKETTASLREQMAEIDRLSGFLGINSQATRLAQQIFSDWTNQVIDGETALSQMQNLLSGTTSAIRDMNEGLQVSVEGLTKAQERWLQDQEGFVKMEREAAKAVSLLRDEILEISDELVNYQDIIEVVNAIMEQARSGAISWAEAQVMLEQVLNRSERAVIDMTQQAAALAQQLREVAAAAAEAARQQAGFAGIAPSMLPITPDFVAPHAAGLLAQMSAGQVQNFFRDFGLTPAGQTFASLSQEDISRLFGGHFMGMVQGFLPTSLDRLEALMRAIQQLEGMLNFGGGGMVPGPVGAPRVAVVHGGEQVLTPGQQRGGNLTVNVTGNVLGADLSEIVADALVEARRRGFNG